MNRIVFAILSQLNRLLLPRFSKRQDLTQLKKWEQALVGWKMWVTYRHLDAQQAEERRIMSARKRELDAGHWTGHPFCVHGHRGQSSGAIHPRRRARRVSAWSGPSSPPTWPNIPFFEFGSRYANATGESLIEGYRSMGKWAAWLYLAITISTCFFVMGAIGIVTASFLDNLFNISNATGMNATPYVAVIVFLISTVVLVLGKYGALDSLIKVIAAVLLISTAGAFIAALAHTPLSAVPAAPADFTPWSGAGLAFLIALMGWMPTAVDLSTWNSIWTLERIKQTGYHPPLKDTIQRVQHWLHLSPLCLALMFLGLGALLFYANRVEFPEGTAAFASGVVQLYTEAIGSWSWWIIATAAFSAMLGTCIACLDGYARSLARSLATLQPTPASNNLRHERWSLVLVAIGALSLILLFPSDIRVLVDIATTLSFLVAPLVAGANLYLVTRKEFPADAKPPKWMIALSWLGLAFLTGFSGLYFLA